MTPFELKEAQRRQAAIGSFGQKIADGCARYCAGKPLTPETVMGVRKVVDALVTMAQAEGIDMPPMHVLAFADANQVFVLRKDMDRNGIEAWRDEVLKTYPQISFQQITVGLNAAFPGWGLRT